MSSNKISRESRKAHLGVIRTNNDSYPGSVYDGTIKTVTTMTLLRAMT